MIILYRTAIVNDSVSVRMFGHDTTISVDEALKYAADGRLFLKANKPASVATVKALVG